MALINCPDCGKQVSTSAQACPSCGCPIAASPAPVQPAPSAPPGDPTELLAEVRPSWWRFFWYLVFAWLIVPWIVAWVKRQSVILRIYNGRVTLERGLLSKCHREFLISDIRAIDIDQTFLARLLNVGDLSISTAATVDADEEIIGVPEPHKIQQMIISQRYPTQAPPPKRADE